MSGRLYFSKFLKWNLGNEERSRNFRTFVGIGTGYFFFVKSIVKLRGQIRPPTPTGPKSVNHEQCAEIELELKIVDAYLV